MTDKRKAVKNHVLKVLRDNKIEADRIHYLGSPQSSQKYYVGESSKLLEFFFARCDIPDDCTIFSDSGKCFKKSDNDVLVNLGF